MSKKKISKNALDEFNFFCLPDTMNSRVHFHDTHKDGLSAITELEKSALSFLINDCNCIDEEECTCDEDLLCLYHAIHRFMETGSREDAFDVYFCYTETFVNKKNRARKLLEMLSDFENSASNLVMKHRDHYSHSVYVFITGLAIYHKNKIYRESIEKTYFDQGTDKHDQALGFLRLWGMTSLFHDVGYPFEIPFEQIKSYFELTQGTNGSIEYDKLPFLAYKQMTPFINLRGLLDSDRAENGDDKLTDEKYNQYARKLMENKSPDSLSELTIADVISHHIARRLDKRKYDTDLNTEDYISDTLLTKSQNPRKFNYYMDHALFSSLLMIRELFSIIGVNEILEGDYYGWMDTLTAIVMHNSLFKFNLRTVKTKDGKEKVPLKIEEHPLAFMLMLCDELQCWDRTSYGRNSRNQLHAMDCEFDFEPDGTICATYLFEKDKGAIEFENGTLKSVKKGTFQKFFYHEVGDKEVPMDFNGDPAIMIKQGDLDTYKIDHDSEKSRECIFYKDIKKILNIAALSDNGGYGLKTGARMSDDNRYRDHSLSCVKLINIYDFASKIYEKTHKKEAEETFEGQTLSTQLSYIQLVKNLAEYLDDIQVFYTDEQKALSQKHFDEFTPSEIRYMVAKEDDRQRDEKIRMCRGGVSNDYITYLNEDPARAATYFRQMFAEKNAVKETDGELIDVADTYELLSKALEIIDEKCNFYYYPGKKVYELLYGQSSGKATEWPESVVMKDLKGRLVKEYSQEEIMCENAIDERNSDEDHISFLKLIHLKEFYRKYARTEEDISGETPIFWYQLGEDNDNARLKVEFVSLYDEDDEAWSGTRLFLVEEIKMMSRTIQRETELDRTLYFFEDDEKPDKYATIYFRQVSEGCIDVESV